MSPDPARQPADGTDTDISADWVDLADGSDPNLNADNAADGAEGADANTNVDSGADGVDDDDDANPQEGAGSEQSDSEEGSQYWHIS